MKWSTLSIRNILYPSVTDFLGRKMHFQRLKDLHRQTRDQSAPELSLRIHRALSWLHKAELSENDLDAQFIFLWISFNAAYAVDVDLEYRTTENGMFRQFFESLVRLDEDK